MAQAKKNVTVKDKGGHEYQYYQITRTVEVTNENGELVKKKKKFYGTSKANAEQKYKDWLEKQVVEEEERKHKEERIEEHRKNRSFGEEVERYVNNYLSVSQRYAKGTIGQYEGVYRLYVKPSTLMEKSIKDIETDDIQQFYIDLDVSQQRLKVINKFMSIFAKWLVSRGYQNIMAGVEIPKKEDNSRHEEIVVWTEEEVSQILESMGRHPRHKQYLLVHMLLFTGMRISEALALKYSDIGENAIKIERQYYLGEEKPPKWDSKRIIPIHESLVEPLRIHTELHKDEMERNHYKTDYVFTTSTGQLFHQASVRKALKRFYDREGIPYKHIHSYRATFCTQLCRCGVSLEVASKLMGHKSMEVTAKHYALVREDSLQDAIGMLKY